MSFFTFKRSKGYAELERRVRELEQEVARMKPELRYYGNDHTNNFGFCRGSVSLHEAIDRIADHVKLKLRVRPGSGPYLSAEALDQQGIVREDKS